MFLSSINKWFSRRGQQSSPRRRSTVSLRVEGLEVREVPTATFNLYTDGSLYARQPDGSVRYLDGGVAAIAPTGGDAVFDLHTNGNLYIQFADGTYRYLDGGVAAIAGTGGNSVFDLHTNGNLYLQNADGSYRYLDGGVAAIAGTGGNSVFDLHTNGYLYRQDSGGGYAYLDGGVQMVGSTGGTNAFDLHTNNKLYLQSTGGSYTYQGTVVQRYTGLDYRGQVTSQMVLDTGAVWESSGGIWQRTDSSGVWQLVSGTDAAGRPATLVLCTNGDIYARNSYGSVYLTGQQTAEKLWTFTSDLQVSMLNRMSATRAGEVLWAYDGSRYVASINRLTAARAADVLYTYNGSRFVDGLQPLGAARASAILATRGYASVVLDGARNIYAVRQTDGKIVRWTATTGLAGEVISGGGFADLKLNSAGNLFGRGTSGWLYRWDKAENLSVAHLIDRFVSSYSFGSAGNVTGVNYNSVGTKWRGLGGVAGVLGAATDNIETRADGTEVYHFANGAIFWEGSAARVYAVTGGFWQKYQSTAPLGRPSGDALTTPDGVTRYQQFQGGFIYSSAATGTHAILGDAADPNTFLGKWNWGNNGLGLPTSEVNQGAGFRWQRFQGGVIYKGDYSGVISVRGTLVDRYLNDRLFFRDPTSLFDDVNMRGLVRSSFQGADSRELRDALRPLFAERSLRTASEELLGRIAQVIGRNVEEIKAEYLQLLKVRYLRPRNDVDNLNEQDHPGFLGSTVQLRYGKVVGDAFGIDPVFGAVLNPTGGLVGPGNWSWQGGNSVLSYHGIVHDAGGYLYVYHHVGPGYPYLSRGPVDPLTRANPLSGQVEGILYWAGVLGSEAVNQELVPLARALYAAVASDLNRTAQDLYTIFHDFRKVAEGLASTGRHSLGDLVSALLSAGARLEAAWDAVRSL